MSVLVFYFFPLSHLPFVDSISCSIVILQFGMLNHDFAWTFPLYAISLMVKTFLYTIFSLLGCFTFYRLCCSFLLLCIDVFRLRSVFVCRKCLCSCVHCDIYARSTYNFQTNCWFPSIIAIIINSFECAAFSDFFHSLARCLPSKRSKKNPNLHLSLKLNIPKKLEYWSEIRERIFGKSASFSEPSGSMDKFAPKKNLLLHFCIFCRFAEHIWAAWRPIQCKQLPKNISRCGCSAKHFVFSCLPLALCSVRPPHKRH